MFTNEKLQVDDNSGDTDGHRYRSLVGQLIYLTYTQLDIAFTVLVLSRYTNNPSKTHAGIGKRVLRYLAGMTNYGLWYTRGVECKLVGSSDSDWGGSMEDKKSTSGVVFGLGSAAISWMSKKQEVIALSTTKAQYVALAAAGCQGLWLRKLMEDCCIGSKETTEIRCDNKFEIAIVKNPMHHGRTKHVDIKFHFIRNLVANGTVTVKHYSIEDQHADLLTKPLSIQKHIMLRSQQGVRNL